MNKDLIVEKWMTIKVDLGADETEGRRAEQSGP